ncbi:hypothetical protein BCR42DRAFT_444376 [Absidia repens]|uniref:Uncharacterized protein n=1 Tax=Absidia repens TaxID=90262 RepID=A0A1X2HR87_9FUNG|nr:hypothetical protein BCR42DRAFT_444376 [Absidia repens]
MPVLIIYKGVYFHETYGFGEVEVLHGKRQLINEILQGTAENRRYISTGVEKIGKTPTNVNGWLGLQVREDAAVLPSSSTSTSPLSSATIILRAIMENRRILFGLVSFPRMRLTMTN